MKILQDAKIERIILASGEWLSIDVCTRFGEFNVHIEITKDGRLILKSDYEE